MRQIILLFLFYSFSFQAVAGAAVPAHATADVFGGGWRCDQGYVRKGDRCSRFKLPANAQLNLLADGWECKPGYVRIGEACQRIAMPPNAERDSFGNSWRCRRGYFQDGTACTIIKIPLHGQLNAAGDDWECERGFKKQVNICIDMEPAEKSRQDQYYQDIYARQMRREGPETAPCRAGYNKCTSSCAALDGKTSRGLLQSNDLTGLCFQACDHGQMMCAVEKQKSNCAQFMQACQGFCPEGVDLCRGACEDGRNRCVYQSREIRKK